MTSQTQPDKLIGLLVPVGLAPKKGPRTVSMNCDFTVSNPFSFDLLIAEDQDRIEWVQSIFIDNSLNGSVFSITSLGSNQKITCPANSQGYFTFLVPQQPRFTCATTGTPIIPIQLMSMMVPSQVWNVAAGGTAAAVTVSGNVSANGDTTITLGNTAQNLFGGVAPTNGFFVANPDPAETLWLSDSAVAAANGVGSLAVGPLQIYETPDNYKPFGVVSIVGATTGHKITARRW